MVAVSDLTELLWSDPDEDVRALAAETLGSMGPLAKAAYPALLQCGKNDSSELVMKAAQEAMEKVGEPNAADVPHLVSALKNANPDYRAIAAQVLGVIGPDARAAIPALRQTLKDGDAQVRLYAAPGDVGDRAAAAQVVPVLADLMQDKDAGVRLESAKSLLKIVPPGRSRPRRGWPRR